MGRPDLVKVSFIIPSSVHRRLRAQRTSMQKIMASKVQDALNQEVGPPHVEKIDSLALVTTRPGKTIQSKINSRAIKDWQRRLARILTSRNRLAVLLCASRIEASSELISKRSEPVSTSSPTGNFVPPSP